MKGKGIVDTFSINLYGSQKNIQKKIDPKKLLSSGKSNVSINSDRDLKNNDKSMKRQNSLGSKKSLMFNEKQKVQQVGKNPNILNGHLRGKLGGAFAHQNIGGGLLSAVFGLGNATALTQSPIMPQLELENDIPVQINLKNHLQNQTAVGLILSQTQNVDEDGKLPDDNKDEKKDESGSFEDFKSQQSFNSISDDQQLRSGTGSINKEKDGSSKPRGSQYKIDVPDNIQVVFD